MESVNPALQNNTIFPVREQKDVPLCTGQVWQLPVRIHSWLSILVLCVCFELFDICKVTYHCIFAGNISAKTHPVFCLARGFQVMLVLKSIACGLASAYKLFRDQHHPDNPIPGPENDWKVGVRAVFSSCENSRRHGHNSKPYLLSSLTPLRTGESGPWWVYVVGCESCTNELPSKFL